MWWSGKIGLTTVRFSFVRSVRHKWCWNSKNSQKKCCSSGRRLHLHFSALLWLITIQLTSRRLFTLVTAYTRCHRFQHFGFVVAFVPKTANKLEHWLAFCEPNNNSIQFYLRQFGINMFVSAAIIISWISFNYRKSFNKMFKFVSFNEFEISVASKSIHFNSIVFICRLLCCSWLSSPFQPNQNHWNLFHQSLPHHPLSLPPVHKFLREIIMHLLLH